MEKYNKKIRMNIMLYSTYTILYINDKALEFIEDIEPFVKNEDKETKKIFGALKKRVNAYRSNINKIIENSKDEFADFNSEMDEFANEPLDRYENAIREAYKDGGLVKYEYYTKCETFRSLVSLSVAMASHIIEASSKIEPQSYRILSKYVMSEIGRVTENFVAWTYGRIKEEVNINMQKNKEVMDSFKELNIAVAEYKNFESSYEKSFCSKKKNSNNIKRKVMAVESDGQKHVFDSISDTAECYGCSRSTITRHISKHTKYKGIELKGLWI